MERRGGAAAAYHPSAVAETSFSAPVHLIKTAMLLGGPHAAPIGTEIERVVSDRAEAATITREHAPMRPGITAMTRRLQTTTTHE